jgi:hypothetical protein
MPARQKPDGVFAGSSKRHASRFYQLKTGRCLTGQYLNWTKICPTPQCWWCASGTQTRDHLFKERAEWRGQQRTLWAEVRKEPARGKSRWKVRDLLADKRCSRSTTEIVSSPRFDRPRRRRGEQRLRSWAPRSRNHCFSPRQLSWHLQERSASKD